MVGNLRHGSLVRPVLEVQILDSQVIVIWLKVARQDITVGHGRRASKKDEIGVFEKQG